MKEAHPRRGQSIIEVLLGVAIGVTLVIAGVALIPPALQTNKQAGNVQAAAGVAREMIDDVKIYSEKDWHNILSLATGTVNAYYMNSAQSPFGITPGIETVNFASGKSYRRYFYLSDVYRDASGNVTTTASGNSYDPSSKQVTVVVVPPTTAQNTPFSFASSSWQNTTALPHSPNNSTNGWTNLVSVNNCVYAIGGYPGSGFTPTTTIFYATIKGAGQVGAWNTTTPIPQVNGFVAETNVAAVANNGYLYMLGSGDGSNNTSTVFYAKSNSDCTLGAWLTTTQLPGVLNAGTLMVNNNYMYYIAGYNNTGNSLHAPINADGTLGAWTTQNIAPASAHSVIWSDGAAYNNYLYIPGGANDQGAATSTVFYAAVNASGSIVSWQKTTPLPTALQGTVIALNGYLYVLAGDSQQKTTYYAPINSDGTVGSWTQGANLPSAGYPLFEFTAVGNAIAAIQTNTANVIYTVATPPTGTNFTILLTRNTNNAFTQSDWSGGPGDVGPVSAPPNDFYAASTSLLTTSMGSLSLITAGIGSIQYVQGATTAVTSTVSATFASPVGAPFHMILVAISFWGSVDIAPLGPPTDSLGNTYTLIKNIKDSARSNIYLYASTRVNGGNDTVTFQTSAANETEISMAIAEFSGADEKAIPADATAAAISSSNGTITNSGNFSVPAGDLAIGVMTHDNTESSAVRNGFTLLADVTDNAANTQPLSVEYKIPGGAVTASTSYSLGAADGWAQIGAAFGTGHGPFALVQSTSTTIGNLGNQNISSASTRFPGTVTAGDTIIAAVSMVATTTSSTLTDSLGTIFTRAGNLLSDSGSPSKGSSEVFYGESLVTGSDTITFTQNPAVNGSITLQAGDFSGVAGASPVIDVSGEATDGGTPSTNPSLTLTPGQGGDLAIGAGTWENTVTVTLGGSYNAVSTPFIDADAGQPLTLEYRILPGGNNPLPVSQSFSASTRWTWHGIFFNQRGALTPTSGTLESAVFDTGVTTGAQLNSVKWKGSQPAGTTVGFQFAVSNSSNGPWNYMGPDGTSSTFYMATQNVGLPLSYTLFNNFEYYRYKVTLFPDATLTQGPTIMDIIVNWSP